MSVFSHVFALTFFFYSSKMAVEKRKIRTNRVTILSYSFCRLRTLAVSGQFFLVFLNFSSLVFLAFHATSFSTRGK